VSQAVLEHVNVTVSDPEKTARMLCDIFGWRIRWQGDAIDKGYTYHVGSDDSYVAVYFGKQAEKLDLPTMHYVSGLNHIGVVVDDLNEIEKRVKQAGFTPYSHADYEPGKRFYFTDHDDIEIEVVSYS